VDHDHDTNLNRLEELLKYRSGGETPRVLPGKFFLSFGVFKFNLEHLGKVLAKAVGGSGLNTSTRSRHKGFNSGGVISSREFFIFSLFAGNDRNSQQFFIDFLVEIQNVHDFSGSFFFGSKDSVTFLPEEFSGSDKGCGLFEFPSDHICPLVELQRKISMGSNPVGVRRVHNGFRGRSNGDGFLQSRLARFSYPGDL
jgi:hypothetical protein